MVDQAKLMDILTDIQNKLNAAGPIAVPTSLDEFASAGIGWTEVEELIRVFRSFRAREAAKTRCKLAAKINAIDKFIFVNRQGVKVIEKTKMRLVREVRDGTVSIISDGLLFSRALESVIVNLRESRHEQQTGSAYNPESA